MIEYAFPRTWKAEILPSRPLILPPQHFVYPVQVEEVERGALEVLIHPAPPASGHFLATCALGFAGSHVPTGVWACPKPESICIAAGGYVYLIDTNHPTQWQQVEYRPVTAIYAAADQGLLLFVSFHSIEAWNRDGKVWQTSRLSWDGLRITEIEGPNLHGFGWDMTTDREHAFEVNLLTGQHKGGGYLR